MKLEVMALRNSENLLQNVSIRDTLLIIEGAK